MCKKNENKFPMKNLRIILMCLSFSLVFMQCNEDKIDGESLGNISGTIVVKGSNVPLENVKVSTNPASSVTFTGADGKFNISNIKTGDYSVQAELSGYITSFEGVSVIEDLTGAVAIEMSTSNANNEPPSIPNLVFPEDGATDLTFEVQFKWESTDTDANDELNYKFELRNGETNEIQLFETAQDTFYTVSNLKISTSYFWQVTVNDGTNGDVVSAVSQFKTIEAPNNPFYFVKTINGNSVIFSGNEDLSGSSDAEIDVDTFQLTSETTNSFRPRFNVGQQKVAFLRNVGGNTQLFTMDQDGTNSIQVSDAVPVNGFRLDEVDYCWALNGSKLYYPNFTKLQSVNPDGSGTAMIYETADGSLITEVEVSEFDNDLVLLKTNNLNGYNARVFTLRLSTGAEETVIAEGFSGAMGGIDITANADKVIYTRDISNSENSSYRQFQSRLFLYEFATGVSTALDTDAVTGKNDLDPKFSPDEGAIVFTRSSNNATAIPEIFKFKFDGVNNERQLFSAAKMPDWE